MSWVDDITVAVGASTKLDDSMKQLLAAFLQSNRSTLEQLGPTLGDTFFRTLDASGPRAAWDVVAQNLTPAQVTALLAATQQEMTALADAPRAADGTRLLVEALAQTALGLLVRALLAAL